MGKHSKVKQRGRGRSPLVDGRDPHPTLELPVVDDDWPTQPITIPVTLTTPPAEWIHPDAWARQHSGSGVTW